MSQAVVETFLANKDTIRSLNIPDEIRLPIIRGLSRVITGPGVTFGSYHSTTGERLFRTYPNDILPIAGKTGTAQGRAGLPWNDSSAFGAFSLDPARPIVVTAYLEKSGYGAKAAAPVVKCMFMAVAGVAKMGEVLPSNPLDITATVAAPQRLLSNKSCLGGAAYGGRD